MGDVGSQFLGFGFAAIAVIAAEYDTSRTSLLIMPLLFCSVGCAVGVGPAAVLVQDGLTLDVRPTVSHDRKYVTMEVQPTLATLLRPIRTFETNLSGISTPVVFELPEISYSQAATTVKVPDGGYVVIGGLKHVSTVDRRSETPILSNIPLLSFLFTRKGRSDEIRDLIIVIHVRILDLTEEEQNLAR